MISTALMARSPSYGGMKKNSWPSKGLLTRLVSLRAIRQSPTPTAPTLWRELVANEQPRRHPHEYGHDLSELHTARDDLGCGRNAIARRTC